MKVIPMRHDPHYVPRKSETQKAATFMVIGIWLVVIGFTLGYYAGR